MASEKTDAIVIRVVEFSETSCIVTMLTREFGKVTAIAKGARRPKSPFEAAIDVLAICRIVFIQKTNAMSLLTEAKLEHRFRAGENSLTRLYIGFYVIELLRILTDDGDPQPELYQLTFDMIRQLDSDLLSERDLKLRLLQFELGLLDLIGHLPMLTRCVNCGREKTQLSSVHFGLIAGGVLCHKCRRGQQGIVSISESGFKILLTLVGGQIGESKDNSDNWNQPNRVNESRLRNKSWTPTAGGSGSLPPNSTMMLDFQGKKTKTDERFDPSSRTAENSTVTTTGDDSNATSDAKLEPFESGESENAEQTSEAETKNVEFDTDDLFADARPIGEVRRLVNQYITHLIGYPPKLHKFLQDL